MKPFVFKLVFILILQLGFLCSCSIVPAFDSQKGTADTVLVLKNGNLIDGTGTPPVSDSLIMIESGRISKVGKIGELKIPSGAETIDLKGATILPGFINTHVHAAYSEVAPELASVRGHNRAGFKSFFRQ